MLTYNREALVSRAIDSILFQNFSEFEFIIVNNGSSDRSGKIAEEYSAKDKRISVVHLGRGNIGSGRNAGLDKAKGEYIAFIDDDDWCECDFLGFLHKLAVENDADVSICGAADKEFDEKINFTAEDALVELLWRKRFNVQFPTKLIKSKLFKNLRFSETAKYDDIELMPKVLSIANKVSYHGLAKYTFERHANNNSAWTTNHSLLDPLTLDEYLNVYRNRTDYLISMFPQRKAVWCYFEWSFMISMVEKIRRLGISGCEQQLDYMVKVLQKAKDDFLSCESILDFEREWIRDYV